MPQIQTPIARFMVPTWGPSRADRTQVGPILAPWTLLSGKDITSNSHGQSSICHPTSNPIRSPLEGPHVILNHMLQAIAISWNFRTHHNETVFMHFISWDWGKKWLRYNGTDLWFNIQSQNMCLRHCQLNFHNGKFHEKYFTGSVYLSGIVHDNVIKLVE